MSLVKSGPRQTETNQAVNYSWLCAVAQSQVINHTGRRRGWEKQHGGGKHPERGVKENQRRGSTRPVNTESLPVLRAAHACAVHCVLGRVHCCRQVRICGAYAWSTCGGNSTHTGIQRTIVNHVTSFWTSVTSVCQTGWYCWIHQLFPPEPGSHATWHTEQWCRGPAVTGLWAWAT